MIAMIQPASWLLLNLFVSDDDPAIPEVHHPYTIPPAGTHAPAERAESIPIA